MPVGTTQPPEDEDRKASGAASERTPDDVGADFADDEEGVANDAALDLGADAPDDNVDLDDPQAGDSVDDDASDPMGASASDPPGADTEGLDAAPSETPSRLGAGSAGDLTGLDDDEVRADDADGADGSDIAIDDDEVDPDNPRDLVDIVGPRSPSVPK